MTKNRDLDTPFLADCDEHRPAVPVTRDGEIVGWLCYCGTLLPAPKPRKKP